MPKLIVIGGSFGAINALKVILASLPADFPAAILIVTHIGANNSVLPEILGRISTMPVRHATDGEPIIPGKILLAPPDEHLTVEMAGTRIYTRLVHGPKENHCRPAVDPLFRSAAATCGIDTVGVVLTGYLDDGTVGLHAVKACGGIAIAQDPAEAEGPEMPASALKYVDVDMKLRLSEIGPALIELVAVAQVGNVYYENVKPQVPDWIHIENRVSGRESDMADIEKIGTPSSLTCPECNGALWEIKRNGPIRYRCHTGHAFTAKVLEVLQSKAVEEAIWGAIRALHEQERLYGNMREKALQLGHNDSAAEYETKSTQARKYSQSLREIIVTRRLIATS